MQLRWLVKKRKVYSVDIRDFAYAKGCSLKEAEEKLTFEERTLQFYNEENLEWEDVQVMMEYI